MALIDEIKLHISAGKGGDGVVRWRREKSRPMGGPGGGNGGRGGDVFIVPVRDVEFLEQYRFVKEKKADNGKDGDNFGRQGAEGSDLILKLPMGSLVKNLDTGEVFELLNDDDKFLILKGGKGGLGNEHFKSSRNVAPYESTPGKIGESAHFHIELRIIADIGLVGLPNAGKSSLLNALTNSKSKIGAYQFTTLDPHLGDYYGKIIADIPGLIEGASEGKGLGHKFLKHITRTKMLWHLVSVENESMADAYKTIRKELGDYDPALLEKQEVILVTKKDLVDEKTLEKKIKEIKKIAKHEHVFAISRDDTESLKKIIT